MLLRSCMRVTITIYLYNYIECKCILVILYECICTSTCVKLFVYECLCTHAYTNNSTYTFVSVTISCAIHIDILYVSISRYRKLNLHVEVYSCNCTYNGINAYLRVHSHVYFGVGVLIRRCCYTNNSPHGRDPVTPCKTDMQCYSIKCKRLLRWVSSNSRHVNVHELR